MITIPTIEPTTLRAGDSVQWTKPDLAEFPPASWTLAYTYIQQAGAGKITMTAANVSGIHTVNEPPATTALWIEGLYNWVSVVSNGTDRHTINSGIAEILPDLTQKPGAYDGRSHVKKTLDALESLIEGKPNADVVQTSIGDRSITRMSPLDLLEWRDRYRQQYCQEQRKAGGKGSKLIRAQFSFQS